jgi:hypothetical protein
MTAMDDRPADVGDLSEAVLLDAFKHMEHAACFKVGDSNFVDIPDEMGKITYLDFQRGRSVAYTESGIPMILPVIR